MKRKFFSSLSVRIIFILLGIIVTLNVASTLFVTFMLRNYLHESDPETYYILSRYHLSGVVG